MFFAISDGPSMFLVFFFNDTATTEIYTLSLHDALPISAVRAPVQRFARDEEEVAVYRDIALRARAHECLVELCLGIPQPDRKSTRLNSSHVRISYAVFCLKKKKDAFIDLPPIRRPSQHT